MRAQDVRSCSVACIDRAGLRYYNLPQGSAGLDYGCPPHIGDAVGILKEAWDKISPAIIAGCWQHSRCLPVLESTEVVSVGVNYHKKLHDDTVLEMCDRLSCLTITESGAASMLSTMGLESLWLITLRN